MQTTYRDNSGRPSRIIATSGSTPVSRLDLAYNYTSASTDTGLVNKVTDYISGKTTTYTHDGQDRLTIASTAPTSGGSVTGFEEQALDAEPPKPRAKAQLIGAGMAINFKLNPEWPVDATTDDMDRTWAGWSSTASPAENFTQNRGLWLLGSRAERERYVTFSPKRRATDHNGPSLSAAPPRAARRTAASSSSSPNNRRPPRPHFTETEARSRRAAF